jgi:DNA-binding HxlR family transcriptional regulator
MVPNDSSVKKRHEWKDGAPIPVAAMVEGIVGCKWSVRILQLCAEGHRRPSAFLRTCPGLSAKVMNERWRKMIRFGIVQRSVFGDKPPVEVEYRLTPFGRRFMRILKEVRRLQDAVDSGAIPETGNEVTRPPAYSSKKLISRRQPSAR